MSKHKICAHHFQIQMFRAEGARHEDAEKERMVSEGTSGRQM